MAASRGACPTAQLTELPARKAHASGTSALRLLLVLLCCSLFSPSALGSNSTCARTIHRLRSSEQTHFVVGVLAIRGADRAFAAWNKTFFDYLTEEAGTAFQPQITFSMEALDFLTLYTAVETRKVDFLFVNPSAHSCIESEYGVTALVSLRNIRELNGEKHEMSKFGGVIFALKDRSDINSARDAKGRVIAAASISGLGSGQAQFRMLHRAGLSYVQDPKQVIFTSHQGKVVRLVESGVADIGFVRTSQLERMEAREAILKDNFKVLDKLSLISNGEEFPLDISTDLYPEWNVGALGHVNWKVQQEVQQALQRMQEHHPAAIAANCAGWRPALSYMVLRNMQEQLGYISWDDEAGVPRCVRSTTLYESIICPPGFWKKSAGEVAESCMLAGQECPEEMQCLCQPCVRGFEFDILPDVFHRVNITSSSSVSVAEYQGCQKMSVCAKMEQNEVLLLTVRDNAGETANVSWRWHGESGAMQNYARRSGSEFYVEIESTSVGTHMLEVLANGEQLEQSPIFVKVVSRDCRTSFGDSTDFVATSDGICKCPENTVWLTGACVSVLGTIMPAVLVPILVMAWLVMYILVRRSRAQTDLIWKIRATELLFPDPPEVLGQGTFGQVVAAEYRGTKVAVKHVLPALRGTRTLAQRFGDLTNHHSRPRDRAQSELTTTTERKSSSDRENSMNGLEEVSLTFRSTESLPDAWGQSSLQERFMDGASWRDRVSSKGGNISRHLRLQFVAEMRVLSKLRHPCITSILGAVMGTEPMLIMELMENGSLHDLLRNTTVEIEGELVLPILQDVSQGLRFLHAADEPFVHGDIKAQNILVDSRFRAKVADFGLTQKKTIGFLGTPAFMAPELLRGETLPTPASDVYAFSILLCEIYSRNDPYYGERLSVVLEQVADPEREEHKRCEIPAACPPEILGLIKDCWEDVPDSRPSFPEIDRRLHLLDANRASPVTNSIFSYRSSKNRENRDSLLYDVFPKHVVEALSEGRKVEPDTREMASVFFCDIVNFTELSSRLSPSKISNMLDRLYSKFDELSQEHKVFKVETIGDTYMAVTNLAEDQLSDHAVRLGRFALAARDACDNVLIDVDNDELGTVKIRIGVHCGPVVGNVVGTRKPKYTLFGDTVNCTSRMESYSLEGKVQMSERFTRILKAQCPAMKIEERGLIDVKGKGKMRTFWLLGERGHKCSIDASATDEPLVFLPNAGSACLQAAEVSRKPSTTSSNGEPLIKSSDEDVGWTVES